MNVKERIAALGKSVSGLDGARVFEPAGYAERKKVEKAKKKAKSRAKAKNARRARQKARKR